MHQASRAASPAVSIWILTLPVEVSSSGRADSASQRAMATSHASFEEHRAAPAGVGSAEVSGAAKSSMKWKWGETRILAAAVVPPAGKPWTYDQMMSAPAKVSPRSLEAQRHAPMRVSELAVE